MPLLRVAVVRFGSFFTGGLTEVDPLPDGALLHRKREERTPAFIDNHIEDAGIVQAYGTS